MHKKEYVDVFLITNTILCSKEPQIPEYNILFLLKDGFQKLMG